MPKFVRYHSRFVALEFTMLRCMRLLRLLLSVLAVFALSLSAWSADDGWQAARIEDVQRNVDTQTMYWVANTPVTRDEITYRITVHYKNKMITGLYSPSRSQPAPPEEWTKDRLVKVRIVDDSLHLKAMSGDEFKTHIAKRKNAPMLPDIPATELEAAYSPAAAPPKAESPIGFSKPADDPETSSDATTEARMPNADANETPSGTLSVRTVPYLADVYVDGNSAGYSPAKVNLAPGKHVVRLEKPGYKTWSQEVTVVKDSDLPLDVTLTRK